MPTPENPSHWNENTSQEFVDMADYIVPLRSESMRFIIKLVQGIRRPSRMLELCCGEGLLAEQILITLPHMQYWGLDGSDLMLKKAGVRLSRFGARVILNSFELADDSWHSLDSPVDAVISSLAIHHLEGDDKQQLFRDIYSMIVPGGALIIFDMICPVSEPGRIATADAWDEVVLQRSTELDGNTRRLDFFIQERWNTYRFPDPADIDFPSPLFDQLKWLERVGFKKIDVHMLAAGHALFSAWKPK